MSENGAISDDRLHELVTRFYTKVRRDTLIGPLFNRAIDNWPEHLEKLAGFWSSVMLTSGRYKGNPMAAHLKHAAEITPEMFERWLQLWHETTAEMFDPEAAQALAQKADRIAESLQLAIRFRPGAKPFATPSAEDKTHSYRPYKSTPIFDQDSLPDALRREHRTKPGVWGVIRVLNGTLRLHFKDGKDMIELSRETPGLIQPEETHWVEPVGPMTMRVDFHDAPPRL